MSSSSSVPYNPTWGSLSNLTPLAPFPPPGRERVWGIGRVQKSPGSVGAGGAAWRLTWAKPTASGRLWAWSVGVSRIFGPLQLHFQPLHANLKAIHGLDGSLRAGWVVKAHEACRDRGGPAMVGNVGVFHSASWLVGS